MSNSVKKEKKKLIIDIAIVVVIVAIIAFVIFVLTNHRETIQTTDTEPDNSDSISCHIDSKIENQFFDFRSPKTISQEVKATFNDNKPSKLFYSFVGEYESSKEAESASALITAAYNEYLGGHGISLSTISHTIYSIDSTARADLYAEIKNVNLYTSKFFLLDSNEFNSAKSLGPKSFEKLYKNKGFTCENTK